MVPAGYLITTTHHPGHWSGLSRLLLGHGLEVLSYNLKEFKVLFNSLWAFGRSNSAVDFDYIWQERLLQLPRKQGCCCNLTRLTSVVISALCQLASRLAQIVKPTERVSALAQGKILSHRGWVLHAIFWEIGQFSQNSCPMQCFLLILLRSVRRKDYLRSLGHAGRW